jgi:hypothetical protein
MACLGEIDVTLETLTGIAPRLSPGMLSWMESDTDFDTIREEPRFKALIEQAKTRLGIS